MSNRGSLCVKLLTGQKALLVAIINHALGTK